MVFPRGITRDLETAGIDPTAWRSQALDTTFSAVNGQQLTYRGDALVSQPAETQSLEFEFKTYPLASVTVQLSVLLSNPASVRLYVNNQVVDRFELTTSTNSVPTTRVWPR